MYFPVEISFSLTRVVASNTEIYFAALTAVHEK